MPTQGAARYGSAIYDFNSASTSILECYFKDNKGHRGTIYINSSDVLVAKCKFIGNNMKYGGGIYNFDSSPTIYNCVFSSNWGGGNYTRGAGLSNTNSAPIIINCIFHNNELINGHTQRGGAIWNSNSSPEFSNCLFFKNTAGHRAICYNDDTNSTPKFANCIFWQNISRHSDDDGVNEENWKFNIKRMPIPAQYPNDPNKRDVEYATINIFENWNGDQRAYHDVPIFLNADDPDGPDDIWFTADDGLQLIAPSPGIDAGSKEFIPSDSLDIDSDGNTTELIPFDILGKSRIKGSSLDIGPYEYDPTNPPQVAENKYLILITSPNNGNVSGSGYFDQNTTATLSATPHDGYVFSGWSGAVSGISNQLSILVDSNKTITANFTQDLNDTDGDGLSNYAELITFGTKVGSSDSDGDGFNDSYEIQTGSDPNYSNAIRLEISNENPRWSKLPDILIADFENGYGDWIVEGEAFGDTPANGSIGTQQLVSGFLGSGLVNTFINGDSSVGILTSPDFVIERPWINFFIGGGNHASQTCINLMIGDEVLKTATGKNNEFLVKSSWFVGNHIGKIVKLEIIDSKTGSWGHINIDHITMSYFPSKTIIDAENDNTNHFGKTLDLEYYVNALSEANATFEQSITNAKTEGETLVTSNPSAFNLVTKSAYDQALLDANASTEKAIADAKSEGEYYVISDPAAYNLVTQDAYDQMMNDLMSASDSNATHYTEGWFFLPNRGWMWTNRSAYPYFFDAEDKDWMYFQSGEEKPRFYRYKTKSWLTIE